MRTGGGIVVIAKMGIGDLAERVSAGGGIHRDAPAPPGIVVPETQVQAARVLRSNIICINMAYLRERTLTGLFSSLNINKCVYSCDLFSSSGY
jgi:hypothetical protein